MGPFTRTANRRPPRVRRTMPGAVINTLVDMYTTILLCTSRKSSIYYNDLKRIQIYRFLQAMAYVL